MSQFVTHPTQIPRGQVNSIVGVPTNTYELVSRLRRERAFFAGGAELCAELCYREKGELEMLEDLFTDAALLTARPHFLTARLESIPHAD